MIGLQSTPSIYISSKVRLDLKLNPSPLTGASTSAKKGTITNITDTSRSLNIDHQNRTSMIT